MLTGQLLTAMETAFREWKEWFDLEDISRGIAEFLITAEDAFWIVPAATAIVVYDEFSIEPDRFPPGK